MMSGDYNGTSSIIAFSALVLVGYASFVYFRRIALLTSGKSYGYLDFVGPSLLAIGVGVGVFIVFADAIKGSEVISFLGGKEEGKKQNEEGDRRYLMEQFQSTPVESANCILHSTEGLNLLEFKPRDVMMLGHKVLSATPQSFIYESTVLAEIHDVDIASTAATSFEKVFALSTGPKKTELLEINPESEWTIRNRFEIKDSPSSTGTVTVISQNGEDFTFVINLDGTMHTYQVSHRPDSATLSRTGSLNEKVFNRGIEDTNPVISMTQFEGVTYLLRTGAIDAWDMVQGTQVAEIPLPAGGSWRGIAFERKEKASNLRQTGGLKETSVVLHLLRDSFPPQHWSFYLEEDGKEFSFPDCASIA